MALLGFSKDLVPSVEAGTKPHTIREWRKHPIKQGETLYLYTGLRTKAARLLFTTPCTRVQRIEMQRGAIRVDGRLLGAEEMEQLAMP